jgi:hypothetical protein
MAWAVDSELTHSGYDHKGIGATKKKSWTRGGYLP